jgi:hypothetical protein
MIHCRFHKNPSVVPIVKQINPVHTLPAYFFKVRFIIIL